ncbi:MAG: DUF4147 domain-containing protein [Patescibacteria group bacterium]
MMVGKQWIKNFSALAKNPARELALRLAEAAFDSIETRSVVRRAVSFTNSEFKVKDTVIPLEKGGRIFIVSSGKCSLAATLELEEIIGERITDGVVIDVENRAPLKYTRFYLGDHPFPTENNINATAEIINLLSQVNQDDLVIFIISGGGSAFLCQPENHTCLEETMVTKTLFRHGATIEQLNIVRKHLSRARGGYLAQYAYPARVVSLIFSDVPGNNLSTIASGPTVMDQTTIEDAKRIIGQCDKGGECQLILNSLIETPKETKYFERVTNFLLLTNEVPLRAMADLALTLGLTPTIKNSAITGEACAIGEAIAKELALALPGNVYLYGGETTVTIHGVGRGNGGRNQELILGALSYLSPGEVILALASDGVDNSEYAGALCDTMTSEQAKIANMLPERFLEQNDSTTFFTAVGDYLRVGYTGANVSDLIIALKLKHA